MFLKKDFTLMRNSPILELRHFIAQNKKIEREEGMDRTSTTHDRDRISHVVRFINSLLVVALLFLIFMLLFS
jgi:hypothetical protein